MDEESVYEICNITKIYCSDKTVIKVDPIESDMFELFHKIIDGEFTGTDPYAIFTEDNGLTSYIARQSIDLIEMPLIALKKALKQEE